MQLLGKSIKRINKVVHFFEVIMSLAAILAWATANQALIATVLFALSELLGANPKFKSNGLLSLILLQVQGQLKAKGAKDLTP